MKKLSSALAAFAIIAAGYSGAAMAARVSVGIYAGVPAPYYYAPPPVVYVPQPIIYAPQPYYAPQVVYTGRPDWRERRWHEREWRREHWERDHDRHGRR